jgi:hypothetical protein
MRGLFAKKVRVISDFYTLLFPKTHLCGVVVLRARFISAQSAASADRTISLLMLEKKWIAGRIKQYKNSIQPMGSFRSGT